jgi:AbrB family looped-hinge helix DNA binding protein
MDGPLAHIDRAAEGRYTFIYKSITWRVRPMASAIISEKGWIVIPVELRKKYELRPGAHVVFVDYGGVLAIVPALKEPVREAAGMVKGGRSLLQALRKEHARERERVQARERPRAS